MTQIATVTAVPGPGTAVVQIVRKTACGHDCETCGGGCGQGGTLTVTASCAVPVEPGDRVELTSGGRVLLIAALVYLVPVALFLAGYLIPAGLAEPLRYLCGGAGFALGVAMAVVYDRRVRRKNAVSYLVTRKL